MKIQWAHGALKDLKSALDYYEAASDRLPRQFRAELDEALAFIAERPERLPLRKGFYRRVNFRKYPYHLPYAVVRNSLWILAVAHNQRAPEYWLARWEDIA